MVGATKTIITKMGRLKLCPSTVVANNKCSILSSKQSFKFNKYLCFVMIMTCMFPSADTRKMNSGKLMQNTEAATETTTSISSKEHCEYKIVLILVQV